MPIVIILILPWQEHGSGETVGIVAQPGSLVEGCGKVEVALHGGGHSATLGALLRGKMGDGRWEMGGHTYERAYHTAGAIRHHRYAPDPTRPLRRHGRGSRAWRGHAGAVAR